MSIKNAKKGGETQDGSLGLGGLGNLSSLLKESSDGPLHLPLDVIDEDPDQPRKSDNPGFSEASLKELAETIRARGVKSPISVRENPEAKGRYIINHGARRVRASKIAGKETIPAFVDNDYNEVDQVIENLQRNELTAREIAVFIGRELARGKKKGEIAKELGKSPAFVTQHATLLDLPEPIAKVFNSGRANDVTVVNELVTIFKKNPDEVTAWLENDDQDLTRGSVKLFRDFLDDKRQHQDDEGRCSNTIDAFTGKTDSEGHDAKNKKANDPEKLKRAIVLVKHDDRMARLLVNRRPSAEGWAWLKYEDDGNEIEVDLSNVQLVSLLEG